MTDAYDNGLARCPGCGATISFSVPADVVVLDLACVQCGTVFQIEKPDEP